MIAEDEDSGSDRTESNSSEENDEDSDCESESESEAESNSSVSNQFGVFTGNGMMVRVEEDAMEFERILKSFVLGMGSAAGDTNVVAVHKNSISGSTDRARFETFRVFSQAVAQKCGGNPNIKYAWYGGSRDDIAEILLHGFTSGNYDECGRIQLVPVKLSLNGALASNSDEDGLRHILLCRVILGKTELVPPGSEQVVPGSNEFDSGVDSLVNPRTYFVWSAFMNSHICPAYVVSFKAPSSLKEYATITTTQAATIASAITQGTARYRKTVHSRRPITLPVLMAALTRFLPPREMAILVRLLNDFKARKISGEELKRKARLIAGDKLVAAMKLMSSTTQGSGTASYLKLENGSVRDIYLPGLITVLASFVPPPKTAMLSKSLSDFRANKITRRQLARSVRVVVGDDNVLVAAIDSYRSSKKRQQGNPLV